LRQEAQEAKDFPLHNVRSTTSAYDALHKNLKSAYRRLRYYKLKQPGGVVMRITYR